MKRFLGLRLRDGIAVMLIWFAAGTSCLSAFLFWRSLRRYVVPSVAAGREAVAYACAASNFCARALEYVSATSSGVPSTGTGTNDVPSAPVVLGYGQTRSPRAVYIYRDTRLPSGEVRRDYIQRIPFAE